MPEIREQCQSCAIQIGPDYMEKTAYHVGKFTICSWCLGHLATKGHIELDGRRLIRGVGTVCRWLYPDGTVTQMRLVATRTNIAFIPLGEPLPDDVVEPDRERQEEEAIPAGAKQTNPGKRAIKDERATDEERAIERANEERN